MQLLSASNLSLVFGDVEIFSGLNLEVADRARIGVVGPNGDGKTSLIEMLVGERDPGLGTVTPASGLRIGYVPQRPPNAGTGTLRDEVMEAFAEVNEVEHLVAEAALEIQRSQGDGQREAQRHYAGLLNRYDALGGHDYVHRMDKVVEGVGLARDALDTPVAAASGGQRTRAALVKALLMEPDLLVLDEPTNYLDFPGLDWLEEFLGETSSAYIAVSHDRYFLDRVANETWELERGRLQRFPGNYTRYRELKEEQTVRHQVEFERQQEYIAKEEEYIRRYKAGQRSRQARGRATRLARLERIEAPRQSSEVSFAMGQAERTGQVVLRTHGLQVGFETDSETLKLLDVADLRLERGSRIAVLGPNGVGKTSLVRTLLGELSPLAGAVEIGHNVKVGYHRQGLDDLPERSSVLDALLDIRNIGMAEARNYLARFLFHGDEVFQHVASLSGGERNRLALARLIITQPNVLILDEPTTHLDIPSREALEGVLASYDGTLVFVSHDRRFISKLASQLWILDGGEAKPFVEGFDRWREYKRLEEAAARDEVRPPKPVMPRPIGGATTAAARADSRKRKAFKREEERRRQEAGRLVTELEALVEDIERRLTAASEKQDVEEIGRLGREYEQAQAQLDEALERWAE